MVSASLFLDLRLPIPLSVQLEAICHPLAPQRTVRRVPLPVGLSVLLPALASQHLPFITVFMALSLALFLRFPAEVQRSWLVPGAGFQTSQVEL